MTGPVELSKRQIDVGTMVHDWEAAETFWAEVVGLPYTKFEKIGGGVRQHRFDANGSVVKVNHSRNALANPPSVYRGLRIVSDRVDGPEVVHDPEGVEIELVPAGYDGVHDVEVICAVSTLDGARAFWVDGLGAEEFETARFRLGHSIVRCVVEAGLERPDERAGPGLRYVTVQVQHVDAAWQHLVDLGFHGDVAPVTLGDTARISFVRDADGGYIEISERAEFTGRSLPPADPGSGFTL